MNREEVIETLTLYQKIHKEAESVARVLGYGTENISFDLEKEMVEVSWEERACSRGCCGYDTHYETFPLSYLWTDNYIELNEVRVSEEKRLQEEWRKKQELESEINSASNRVKTLTSIFQRSEQQWIKDPSKVTEAGFIIAKDNLEKAEEALKQLRQKVL